MKIYFLTGLLVFANQMVAMESKDSREVSKQLAVLTQLIKDSAKNTNERLDFFEKKVTSKLDGLEQRITTIENDQNQLTGNFKTLSENQKKLEDRMQLNEKNHTTLQKNLQVLQNDMRGAAYFQAQNIHDVKNYINMFNYDQQQKQALINKYSIHVWNYVNKYCP